MWRQLRDWCVEMGLEVLDGDELNEFIATKSIHLGMLGGLELAPVGSHPFTTCRDPAMS